jgi:hypothetical protein
MVRRSMLPWPGKLWANMAEPNDDYYTLFNLLSVGKFANLSQKLIYYRMHSSNKSLQHVKKKFINSLKIRWFAVRELGYPVTPKMFVKLLAQTVYVLTVPEWLTVGTYLTMKGMKPFDQAFPLIGELKYRALQAAEWSPRWQLVVPTLLASFFYSITSKK